MPRPRIGITMDSADDNAAYSSYFPYAGAIEKAGGLPLLLPFRTDSTLIPEYLDQLDGILFTGGDDLDPGRYNETRHPRAQPVDPERERFEFALLAKVERRRIPALFICMGLQLLNVHRGGSLYQFIPDLPGKLEHRKVGQTPHRHPVHLERDSRLAAGIGETEISVNTYHKQAVHQLGQGLRQVGCAPDGIIEALEDPSMPFMLAVQWHPERLTDEREHRGIFQLLIGAAARYSRS